jgi:hypothetical protein
LSNELPAIEESSTGSVEQTITQCPEYMCGMNSPQIASFGFWDLQMPPSLGMPGGVNNVGLQVYGFFSATNQLMLPRVIGGRLIAVSGSTTLWGTALVNGWFYLRAGNRVFKLRVTDVSYVDSWAAPIDGSHVVLEDYKLDWTEFVNGSWGDFRNMCKSVPSRESSEILTMVGQNIYRTLLFEGDRIDAARKLDTGIDTTWVNLGCAGSALAKMALTGHTEASKVTGAFNTTLLERQTMLKMLGADYCHDGTAFTVAGQPLNWRDDHGTMKLTALTFNPPQPLILESRWNAEGAVCLNKPRVDVHPTALSNSVLGTDIYSQVQAWCPSKMPPQCADSSFDNDGYHLLSATPP